MKLVDLYYKMQPELKVIEERLQAEVDSDYQILKETSQHLLEAGGKRIRPVFVLLSGKFGNYDLQKISTVAITLELIHMASLVHDDVIDNADTRRGYPTVKTKWDNLAAMYTGDYIFAKSLSIVNELASVKIQKTLSQAMVDMCVGEIEQIRDLFNLDQGLKTYLKRIKRKTALLISVSCYLGALATNTERKVAEQLRIFGYNVGMAFQITDDILDFTATSEQLGKPAGSDLKHGNITIPVIYSLCQENRQDLANELREIIESDQLDDNIDRAIEIIKIAGGIDYAQGLSDRYLKKAYASLDKLPANIASIQLYEIAKFIGIREY